MQPISPSSNHPMTFLRNLLLFGASVIYCGLSINPAYAQSPVWKVSQGAQHLYIGGTIHLLSEADYPLPAAFDFAYRAASRLVFETDIIALQSPQSAGKVAQAMLAQDDKPLKSKLKPATWQKLAKYLHAQGIPIATFDSYSVSGAGLIITLVEMQKLGFSSEAGVDQYFANKAVRDSKPLGELESIDKHIAFIQNLAHNNEDAFVLKTLADILSMEEQMKQMKQAWRKGDHKTMEAFGIKQIKQDFPQIYQALLSERNLDWLPQIESLLHTDEIELVLVGALHLVGEDGLIELLRKRGYKVTNLSL